MQKEMNPQVQILLDELTEHSYLVRQKEIAKLFEPYSDIVIPVLMERLKDQSDNYDIRHNAIEVLALLSDPRSTLPLIRHIEIETGWTSTVFDYIRQGLEEKDNNTRQKVNEQLIKYLEEGPTIPAPEPFDPIATENSFNDVMGALMKLTGVTELDDEAQKLAEEVKEKWTQPPSPAVLEKDKIQKWKKIFEIIAKVIDILSAFDGLNDPRLETLLQKYIREYGFDSIASQHALTVLSKIKPSLAISQLQELAISSPSQQDKTVKRVVCRELDDEIKFYNFTICAREPKVEEWKERVYHFAYEQGLVFFLTRGAVIEKWFVGRVSNKEDATRLAIEYLERWIQNIDSSALVEDRYAESIHLVQKFIDFKKWGFKQTHISQKYEYPHERPQIIYDSEWCRVKILFRSYGEMHNQSDVLSILYGRLHAADKDDTILWKGEPYHCWHHVSLALCFLDGMSTEDAAKALWNHPIIAEYKKSKEMQNVLQPSMESEMHAIIWEKYEHRLFELFDLRRPDLWDKYSIFIKEVYEIKGFKYYGHGVPREKIC